MKPTLELSRAIARLILWFAGGWFFGMVLAKLMIAAGLV